jgi:hypothetical protein
VSTVIPPPGNATLSTIPEIAYGDPLQLTAATQGRDGVRAAARGRAALAIAAASSDSAA